MPNHDPRDRSRMNEHITAAPKTIEEFMAVVGKPDTTIMVRSELQRDMCERILALEAKS